MLGVQVVEASGSCTGNQPGSDLSIDDDPVGFPELSRCWWGYVVRIALPQRGP